MIFPDDTICAPATSVGSGAVSIVRISGPDTFGIISSVVRFRNPGLRAGSVKFGEIPGLDEVLVSIFKSPKSYTGEDSAEICCHASRYIVSEILARLTSAGARMAEAGEFTRRAFVNGRMDLAQAESVADLIASDSAASHRVAMLQLKGAYSLELKKLRDQLLELASLLELELDFSEEDVEFADRGKLGALLSETRSQIDSLATSFRTGNAIRNGVPVAIVGAPNTGKSTLLNALLGEERAIVSDIPGTTRDTVEETMVLDGILYRFIDTAGLRETSDTIEKIGVERSMNAISGAQVVISLIDASQPLENASAGLPCGNDSDSRISGLVRSRLEDWQILIEVANKTDLSPAPDGFLGICARSGEGVDELKRRISALYSGRVPSEGILVSNARHRDALVRASSYLAAVQTALASGTATELLAEDLRAAISELSSIFGDRITTDEVLGEIFGKFCIGK